MPRRYIKTLRGYGLTKEGEVWRLGQYGHMAGYCSHPDRFEEAVDAAEEEARVLLAEAREEFGL